MEVVRTNAGVKPEASSQFCFSISKTHPSRLMDRPDKFNSDQHPPPLFGSWVLVCQLLAQHFVLVCMIALL